MIWRCQPCAHEIEVARPESSPPHCIDCGRQLEPAGKSERKSTGLVLTPAELQVHLAAALHILTHWGEPPASQQIVCLFPSTMAALCGTGILFLGLCQAENLAPLQMLQILLNHGPDLEGAPDAPT